MKKLLESITKFAGEPEQKSGEQWKGTDKGTPGTKLVGDSKDNSILKDLSKGKKPKTLEEELAEALAQFNEDDLGVEPKRPSRSSDRPHREYTKHGKPSKRYTPVNEYGKETDNFTAADIKELEGIRDLATLKDRAFALISKPSKRPMKPEKVQWFKSRLDSLTTPIAVIKLMYDLLLSGEGQSVIGSRNSMSSNSYRGRFGEGWGGSPGAPDDRPRRERDPDAEYDAMRTAKADDEAIAAQTKRPQTKVYTLTGRGPNMEPNYKFPGEYASQAEADAARTKLMADPKTPNPRMIGISTHTKYLGEGIESADPIESAVLNAVQELIQQGHTEVAPEVITNMVVAATSQPFLLKDLVDANKNSPAIQHYVDSINPTKVKFSSDILTVKNENPAKTKAKSTNVVSSMASQAASRPRLGESNTPLRDRDDYMAKSKALQDIQVDRHTHQDPQLSAELVRRKAELIQQAKAMGISESRAHKLIANKLKQIELQRKMGSGEQEDGYAQHQRLIKQQQQEYLKKNPNTIYKREIDVDEDMDPPQSGQDTQAAPNQGTNTTANTAININTTSTDPEAKLQAQQALQATQAVKNASGITAPAPNVVKALNTAMTGKGIPGTDSKNLEPMMDIIGQAAQDPKVAQQFKSLAQQANVSKQQQQQKQQK